MKRPGISALETALERGQAALDSLPAVLDEAQILRQRAAACSDSLSRLHSRVGGPGWLVPLDQSPLRSDFIRRMGRLRRALWLRITWLWLCLFWRRIRLWLLILLLLAALLFATVWAARNRDWLAERLASMLSVSAPAQAPSQGQGGAGPAPVSPSPGSGAGKVATP